MKLLLLIIEWCNENAGFVTALGTIATAVVAVLVARWPYRTSMECNPFLDADPEDAQKDEPYTCPLCLSLHNSGNIPLEIKEITVTNEMRTVCGHYYGGWSDCINPMESKRFTFEVHVPEACLAKKMRITVKTQKKFFTFHETWAVG
jgi:hypothetical protein